MKTGSLFSGAGGLDLAVEAVFHAPPAWFVEFEKAPSRALAHHWPDVPNHHDVTKVDWASVEPVDIITGGFPCQDVSHAGKRAGLGAGTRTGLWANMLQAIDTLRPRLVVAENVRGLLSARADSDVEPCPWCMGDDGASPMRALGAILADLADVGYDAAWTGLRAADVGAPHGRFRVFILAWPAANPEGDGWHEGWTESAGQQRRPHAPERGLLPTPTVSDTNGAGAHGDGGLDLRTAVSLLPTPAVNDMGKAYTPDEWDEWTAKMKAAHGNGNGHGKSLEIEAARLLPTPDANMGNGGRTRSAAALARGDRQTNLNDLPRLRWGDYAPAIARWERLTRPAPAPTQPTGKGGAHRLSAEFVEWLMGWPDGHVTSPDIGLTRNEQLKIGGNGVVPQQAEAALHHLLAVRAANYFSAA